MTHPTKDGLFAFDKPTPVDDGQGGEEDGWEEQFQCRGSKINLRGREAVIAARLQGIQPMVVTVGSFSGSRLVTPGWRMRDTRSSVVYDITAVVVSENRREIEITAQSGGHS